MSLPAYNNFTAFVRTDSTDQSTTKVVPLAGLDYVLFQATTQPIVYNLWPNQDQAALAPISAIQEITGSNHRIYKMTTTQNGFNSLYNGLAVEVRDADTTTVHGIGIVQNVIKTATVNPIKDLPFHSTYTPATIPMYFFTLTTSASGDSVIIAGDSVYPLTPAVGAGTILPVTSSVSNGQMLRLPGWAVGSGAIAFKAAATGTAILTINSVVESS